MSLTLVYIGAAAGLAPAASLRALSGGGAVFVPGRPRGRAPRARRARPPTRASAACSSSTPPTAGGLDDLVAPGRRRRGRRRAGRPGGPQLARELRAARRSGGRRRARHHAGRQAFDDALLGQELVSLKRIVDVLRVECPWDREQTPQDIVGYTVEEVYELADAIAADDLRARSTASSATCCCRSCCSPSCCNETAPATSAQRGARRSRSSSSAGTRTSSPTPSPRRRPTSRAAGSGSRSSRKAGSASSTTCPTSFPALLYAKKLQQRAASVGFDWDSATEAFPRSPRSTPSWPSCCEAATAGGAGGRRDATARRPTSLRPARGARGRRPAVRDRQRRRACCTWTRSSRCARPARRFERRVTAAAELAAAEGEDWSSLDAAGAGGVLPARQGGPHRRDDGPGAGAGPGGEPPADAGA